jgi:uncharacterized protein (DUF885 family)
MTLKKGWSRRRLMAGATATGAGLTAGLRLAGAATASDAAAALRALLAQSARSERSIDPLDAVRAKGVDAARFTDPLSDDYRDQRLAAKQRDARGLAAIDRGALSDTDRLAYDVFRYRTVAAVEEITSGLFDIGRMTNLDPSFGLQVSFPDAASGAGAPLRTEADHEAGLARMHWFAGYLKNAMDQLAQGLARGYVQPRIVVLNVLAEVDAMLALPPEATPFYKPMLDLPAAFPAAERTRLAAAYRRVIADEVLPGYAHWKQYLTTTYLPAAREQPGLVAQKDGDRVYAAALARHTTTRLTADEIHALGLSEVARIRGEMEAVRRELKFDGDLHALFARVRTDRSFYFTRPEDLLARFASILDRIWLGMPRLFNRRPKAPFEVRALPSLGETRGTGYYTLGPADGSGPGVLYFNMSMLDTRPIPTLETLALHEGVPGHHFQGSLVQENTRLPDMLRFGGDFTAYVEGWGLYSESLGKELGLFTDPWQWFGHLDFEMLRAVRLVVDTGLHARGWSRDRAIAFMTDNTSMAARDIAVEIDRYIADPGQATAYKVGELRLQALRRRATERLGARFDIRCFHDQLLMTGALPLDILEARIDAWIAAGGPAFA